MPILDLARSVLEAGHTPRTKYARRRLVRKQRREARAFCRDAETLEDLDDLGPRPRYFRRDWDFVQDDKLGCLFRWMDSKVGQPWDEVYSEACKLRGKGIALSHVLDVHLLGSVSVEEGDPYRRSADYIVVDGFLRKNIPGPGPWRSYARDYRKGDNDTQWAKGRQIMENGGRLYWAERTSVRERTWARQSDGLIRRIPLSYHYRQGKPLSPEDAARYQALSQAAKDKVSVNAQ